MNALARIQPDCELPPTGGNVHYYPDGGTIGGANTGGRLFAVTETSGGRWYAMCRGGTGSAEGLFEFGGDPSTFIVLHSGAGYRIAYDNPERWEELPFSPFIQSALYNEGADLILLFDWIRAVGYGPAGRVWSTPRLFLDDLCVVESNHRTVTLKGDELGCKSTVILDVYDGAILSGQPSRFN